MKNQDSLQRFLFEHASIRGEIAHLNVTYQTIIKQWPYPPKVKKLLGEALISCLLLAGSIKFEGGLSLQFQGDERLPLILVQITHHLELRALAQYQDNLSDQDYEEAFLNGKMALMINQNNQTTNYQSIVPIQSISMSENLTHYFAQSEQIASQVWLAVGEDSVAGMLLQLMPEQVNTQQREQFWEYAVQLGQTVSEEELLTLDNEILLHRLYHETELRLFESRSTHFQCRCSEEKMKQAVKVLGKKEADDILKEKKIIEVNCDFCNKQYLFDAVDIALLFHS